MRRIGIVAIGLASSLISGPVFAQSAGERAAQFSGDITVDRQRLAGYLGVANGLAAYCPWLQISTAGLQRIKADGDFTDGSLAPGGEYNQFYDAPLEATFTRIKVIADPDLRQLYACTDGMARFGPAGVDSPGLIVQSGP